MHQKRLKKKESECEKRELILFEFLFHSQIHIKSSTERFRVESEKCGFGCSDVHQLQYHNSNLKEIIDIQHIKVRQSASIDGNFQRTDVVIERFTAC